MGDIVIEAMMAVEAPQISMVVVEVGTYNSRLSPLPLRLLMMPLLRRRQSCSPNQVVVGWLVVDLGQSPAVAEVIT